MYEIEMSKEEIKNYEDEIATRLEIGQSRLSMSIFMTSAALFGVWGITCLVNGISQVSSMQEVGRSLFMALTGI